MIIREIVHKQSDIERARVLRLFTETNTGNNPNAAALRPQMPLVPLLAGVLNRGLRI